MGKSLSKEIYFMSYDTFYNTEERSKNDPIIACILIVSQCLLYRCSQPLTCCADYRKNGVKCVRK